LGRRKPQILTGAAVKFVGKAGKPIAPKVKPKRFGTLRGKIRVPDDFNRPLPAGILAAFGFKTGKK
jgi:hypothetical protein